MFDVSETTYRWARIHVMPLGFRGKKLGDLGYFYNIHDMYS